MTSDRLSDAVQLIKSGNKQAAAPLLKEILRENPGDENAWLWLHVCVEDLTQKKYCLQKALEINPHNQPARNALQKLTEPVSRPVQPFFDELEKPEVVIKPDQRPLFLALGAGALLLVCLAGVAIALALSGQFSSLSAGLPLAPSATMTVALKPTSSVTPGPSSTLPAGAATLRPSRTPIHLEPTGTFTPTSAVITPGNPTSTPLGSDITDANYTKGLTAYKAGKFQLAIDLFSAAIAAHPDLAPPYRYRGKAYWYLVNRSAALADHEKTLSINPAYAAAWSDRGLDHDCLGNDDQAVHDYQKALSLDPSLAMVHHYLGIHYFQKQDFEKSQREYKLSLAIDPTRAESWANLGGALSQLRRYDECIQAANQSLKVSAQEWSAYDVRGYCELSKGDYDASVKDFKVYNYNILDDSTSLYNMGVAYGHRGNVYFDAGKYELAIADYEQAVSLIRGDAHSYCYLSYSYFATKQYRKALDSAKASIAINPSCGSQNLVIIEARSSYEIKDYEAGIEYANKALAMGSASYPLGHYYRGLMYLAIGKKSQAIDDLTQFINSGASGMEADDARARLAKLKP